jgi:hypothetical protein
MHVKFKSPQLEAVAVVLEAILADLVVKLSQHIKLLQEIHIMELWERREVALMEVSLKMQVEVLE